MKYINILKNCKEILFCKYSKIFGNEILYFLSLPYFVTFRAFCKLKIREKHVKNMINSM